MNEIKHTEGEWRIGRTIQFKTKNGKPNIEREISSRGNSFIASVWGDDSEGEANAKLISAAPELLEALKVYLNAGHKEARRLASIQAKEAIKKATE